MIAPRARNAEGVGMLRRTGTVLAVVLGLADAAAASNGLNLVAVSARENGLGGAGVALLDDCPGCNPATIGGSDGDAWSVGAAFLHPPVGYENRTSIPNDVLSDDHVYVAPSFEVSKAFGGGRWIAGLGFRAQGGLGVDFEGATTAFGTRDGFSTDLRFARAQPTLAWRGGNGWRVGVGLVMSWADMSSQLFPNTYSPGFDGIPGTGDDFAGIDLDGVTGSGLAGRVGVHWRSPDARWSFGATYTSETDLDLDGGDLTLDLGFARVRYDAEVPGFAWPQEAEAGLAWQATPAVLVAADLRWIGWSSTATRLAVLGSNPSVPVPLASPRAAFDLSWDDQVVLAVGAEMRVSPRHVLRVGLNRGASPVPDATVSPLFPAIVEDHLTLGWGFAGARTRLDVAFEHSFARSQVNSDPNPATNPFGPGTRVVAHAGSVLNVGLTRTF